MSTPPFDALLAECRKPGGPPVIEAAVLSAEEAERLAAALNALDVQARVLNGAWLSGKADLLRELAAAFEFPEYFGGNWDAVIDCWSDLSWLPARGYVCILVNADALRSFDPAAHETLLEVAEDVAERWRVFDPAVVFKVVRAASE
jgi:hypothetical protein